MTIEAPNPLSDIKVIVVVSAFVLLFGVMGWLFWSRSNLEAQVEEQKTEISDYQNANKQCVSDVATAKQDLQNAIAAGELRQSVVAKAINDSNAKAASFLAKASQISAWKSPGNDCVVAKRWADAYFSGSKP